MKKYQKFKTEKNRKLFNKSHKINVFPIFFMPLFELIFIKMNEKENLE